MRSTKETGKFYCPHCAEMDVPFRHQSAREWFTLYFIPVFPIGGHQEYIECGRCGNTYTTVVLDLVPPTEDDLFLRRCYERLDQGQSLETVEAEMGENGRTGEQAVAMLDGMTRGKVWECERCDAHYLKGVKKCRVCKERWAVPDRNERF